MAGPVTAAAVILPDNFPFDILCDSKKMAEKRRTECCKRILMEAHAVSVGWVWSYEIDTLNIHNASLLAMKRAVESLAVKPTHAVIDGKFTPQLKCSSSAVIKGDSIVPQIMAASIVAKTARDRWMIRHSWFEPLYNYHKHKGYPTREHRQLVLKHGPASIQRKSFKVNPCREV